MNLAKNLENAAFYFPERPALREGGVEINYAQLNERANRVATALIELGLRPGDLAGLCAPNSIDWITFYFGVLKTGAVAVTLSSLLSGDELALAGQPCPAPFYLHPGEPSVRFGSVAGGAGLEKVFCPGGRSGFAGSAGPGIGPLQGRWTGTGTTRRPSCIPAAPPEPPRGSC